MHNDEEWFRLFDGRALEVAVLLVLLLELEEETVVVSTWEAGIVREEGREEGREERKEEGREEGRGEGRERG